MIKNFPLRLIAFFLTALCSPLLACAASFSGEWSFIEKKPDLKVPYATYSVWLQQDGSGAIKGQYCFITQSGIRIDCSPEGQLNITGEFERITGNAIVNFSSFFGAENGKAKLSLEGKWLTWEIIEAPVGGDYYAPLKIRMKRKTSDDANYGKNKIVWKRAYLYHGPSSENRTHAYLIRNDEVKLVDISSDWKYWKIRYSSKQKIETIGWIDCRAIKFCLYKDSP